MKFVEKFLLFFFAAKIGAENFLLVPNSLEIFSFDENKFVDCYAESPAPRRNSVLNASIFDLKEKRAQISVKTQPRNSSSLRIFVAANGAHGRFEIICHWDDDVANGRTADLVVQPDPNQIDLIECVAIDLRYFECSFNVPSAVSSFRKNETKFEFSSRDANTETLLSNREFVRLDEKNEFFVFRFASKNEEIFNENLEFSLNVSDPTFALRSARFFVVPRNFVFSTIIDFQLVQIDAKTLEIFIVHDDSTSKILRQCSAEIFGRDSKKKISATSEKKILVDELRPSSNFRVCLRCFYPTFESNFNKTVCRSIETRNQQFFVDNFSSLGLVLGILFAGFLVTFFAKILVRKFFSKETANSSRNSIKSNNFSSSHLSLQNDYKDIYANLQDTGGNFYRALNEGDLDNIVTLTKDTTVFIASPLLQERTD